MTEPSSYHASAVSIELAPQNKLPHPGTSPRIEGDPLMSFENFPVQVQSDLRGWMTYSVEDREKKITELQTMTAERMATRKITEDRRVKMLFYMMWMERMHPSGDRRPAALAFNALFGPNKAKVKEQ